MSSSEVRRKLAIATVVETQCVIPVLPAPCPLTSYLTQGFRIHWRAVHLLVKATSRASKPKITTGTNAPAMRLDIDQHVCICGVSMSP